MDMFIMKNALREKIRRHELYVVVAIALVVLLLCGTGAATLSIDGKPITDFDNMFSVMHIISNFAACILAAALSLKTIPKEYERKTSCLIWIRGISQSRYHLELAAANAISSLYAASILYAAIGIYALSKEQVHCLPGMLPAFLILSINCLYISLLTSVLSIKLPSFAVGTLSISIVLLGVFHAILDLYKNMIGGFSETLIKTALRLIPDLHAVQNQAQNLILGRVLDIHEIFTALFGVYIISLGFFVLKKKEA